MWGADPDVDGHVEQGAFCASHELPLCVGLLIVQAAQDAARRARVIVLHEVSVDPQLPKMAGMVGFHEEAAFVSEDPGLEDQDPRE